MGAVARVAGRDTHELPAWPLLVAKVGSDVRAAISLTDGTVIADPFHRTAELVAMLRIRARGRRCGCRDDVVTRSSARAARGSRSAARPDRSESAERLADRPACGSPRPRRGGGPASCTAPR